MLGFNKAAETLHYAQSTVSAQIRLLEEEFGKPLFDRIGKTVVQAIVEQIDKYWDNLFADPNAID